MKKKEKQSGSVGKNEREKVKLGDIAEGTTRVSELVRRSGGRENKDKEGNYIQGGSEEGRVRLSEGVGGEEVGRASDRHI